ncbi:MAG: HEAT repeat domain-containing protein [Candidatus Rokubacteria bacterium]|nr:HEAT repeat domain-containing protein [Candidatus Rokubacteria bacterium]
MDYCRRLDLGDLALGTGVAVPDPRYALPGTEPRYAPDRAFDTTHIRLAIDLDLRTRSARAACTTTLTAFHDSARELGFDAVGFRDVRVYGATGRRLRHRYDGRKLTVSLPRPLAAGEAAAVRVEYRVVRPKLGLYFVAPDRAYPTRPRQVWSQCQDEYARYWFPCHDAPHERTTTEMLATVPEGFVAVSNGRLVARRRAGRRRVTWHWRLDTPHSPYLVTLAVGRFRELRDAWRGIPITYYCEHGREDDTRRAFGKTPKAMAFFSRVTGLRYPYAKYAQVAAAEFIYGGMENTTATTQTDTVLHDARAHLEVEPMATGLMAHELAHQWFGDLLTCRDWSHAWLNESFATYFDALFVEHDRGRDAFAHEMWQNARAYLEEDKERYRRPIVTNVFRTPSDLFDRHLYEKGACVLHMLRYVLGEADFGRAIRRYVRIHRRSASVETADLVVAIEEATGRNLRRFFDQWVFKAGHPEYRIAYWWEPRARRAHLVVRQTQKTGDDVPLFAMPLEVELVWGRRAADRRRVRESVEAKEHRFTYRLPREPELVRIDPEHWLLGTFQVTLPLACWAAQLRGDPHPIGRIAAAQALGRLGSAEATALLAAALRRERVWFVQGEIAAALGQIRSPAALTALVRAARVGDPRVRRPVVRALGEFRSPWLLPVLARLAREDPSSFVAAEALRALGRARDRSVTPVITRALREVDSWNDTVRVGAVEGLGDLGEPGVLATLRARTRYGFPHPSRVAAIRTLGRLGRGDAATLRTLLARTGDPYLRVRLAAIVALGHLGDDRALPRLRRLGAAEDVDGRIRRTAAEALRAIRGDAEPPREAAPVRERAVRRRRARRAASAGRRRAPGGRARRRG